MSRHKAQSHQRWPKTLGRIKPDHQREIIGIHIMDITVSGINVIMRESIGHGGQTIVRGEEIIGIQETDHIARGHADSFIHRIVDAIVLLTLPFHAAIKLRLVGADKIQCAIGAAPVNHQIFYVLECLAQDTAKCVLNGGGTIESGGYKSDLHLSGEWVRESALHAFRFSRMVF